jgi:dGTPase
MDPRSDGGSAVARSTEAGSLDAEVVLDWVVRLLGDDDHPPPGPIVAGHCARGRHPASRVDRARDADGRSVASAPMADVHVRAAAVAHRPVPVGEPGSAPRERPAQEDLEEATLAAGATRSEGAGHRAVPEAPDRFRTCFQRDLDRIQHSRPFRRLAGKCQVFIAPDDDHLRTRLTHAVEVAQVASSIARGAGLNVALTTAAAMGHDCGHGPAGHASEEALSPYLHGGYHHAVYGADVVLAPLNLCAETLDAVRNHSWNRPAPATPEGEVVAWADRIAYVCHDFEDACDAGIVTVADLPPAVVDVVGTGRSEQLGAFIGAMLDTMAETGSVALRDAEAGALDAFRAFNFERIYLRPEAREQAERVIALLRSLTDFFVARPRAIGGDAPAVAPGSDEAVGEAVRYVSGMTDRFALALAVEHLGWDPAALPRGV